MRRRELAALQGIGASTGCTAGYTRDRESGRRTETAEGRSLGLPWKPPRIHTVASEKDPIVGPRPRRRHQREPRRVRQPDRGLLVPEARHRHLRPGGGDQAHVPSVDGGDVRGVASGPPGVDSAPPAAAVVGCRPARHRRYHGCRPARHRRYDGHAPTPRAPTHPRASVRCGLTSPVVFILYRYSLEVILYVTAWWLWICHAMCNGVTS